MQDCTLLASHRPAVHGCSQVMDFTAAQPRPHMMRRSACRSAPGCMQKRLPPQRRAADTLTSP